MSNYILIQNDGEIETNSFELIGASTKRNDSAKIGFFGSGLKYSIAYMMRKGIEFKVYSGNNEITFTTKPETLKEQPFDRICINGNPTSYTTTMGPTWKEDWFVLREVYCNALDEGGCIIVKETEHVSPSEGKTRIYIAITDELKAVTENWDAYFADERTPLFESDEVYTCYLGNEDGFVHTQKISAYAKTEGILYRKGIRVHSSKQLMYDYSCNHVNINEDRTAKNPNGLNYGIYNMFSGFVNEDYIKSILRTSQDNKRADEYYAVSMSEEASNWSNEWARFSRENLLVIKESSGKYADEIAASKKEVFLIPSSFARGMKKNVPEAIVLGMSSMIGAYLTNEVEITPKMNFLLKEVISALKEMKYDVIFDVEVVDFDDENVMGQADIKNKKILISSRTFDMGRREIAMTLIEENEHIKSGKRDETRAFQTHIFSQWLKSMEDSNLLFL